LDDRGFEVARYRRYQAPHAGASRFEFRTRSRVQFGCFPAVWVSSIFHLRHQVSRNNFSAYGGRISHRSRKIPGFLPETGFPVRSIPSRPSTKCRLPSSSTWSTLRLCSRVPSRRMILPFWWRELNFTGSFKGSSTSD
jgi:hypothetical protein